MTDERSLADALVKVVCHCGRRGAHERGYPECPTARAAARLVLGLDTGVSYLRPEDDLLAVAERWSEQDWQAAEERLVADGDSVPYLWKACETLGHLRQVQATDEPR